MTVQEGKPAPDFNLPDASGKPHALSDYGEKMMYGKKTVGVIRSTVVIGADGTVLKHWKKVPKAETHPEKVLEFVSGL